MSEQFILYQDDFGNYEIRYDNKVFYFLWELAPILNEQQDIIQSLQKDIIEMSDSHQSYIEMESETRSQMNDIIRTQRRKIFRLEKEHKQLKQKVDFYKYFQKDARELEKENDNCKNDYRELFSNYVALEEKNEQLFEENKRLTKMIWKIQWRFQQEVGIEKAKEHYQEIDKEMEE